MSRIFIMFVICLLFCRCGKDTSTYTLYFSLVNETDKHLLCKIETSVRNDSINSLGADSNSVKFYSSIKFKKNLFPIGGDPFYPSIQIIRESLFNITDTSTYTYWHYTLPDFVTKKDRVFFRHRITTGDDSGNKNGVEYVTLYFTDSVVDIMQKDYTMLEKFKKYYE